MRSTVGLRCVVSVLFASLIAAAALGADPAPAPAPGASQETRTILLSHASAESLGATLTGLFAKAKPLVRITADKKANTLTIVGFADDIRQVEEVAQDFDVPAAASAKDPVAGPGQEVRKIRLLHTFAEPVGAGLKALFADAKPEATITVDKAANTIVVVGLPDDIQAAEKVARQFDVSTSQMEIETDVLETVTNADGKQEVHLNPGAGDLRSGGAPVRNGVPRGPHITVQNGQSGIFQLGETFAGTSALTSAVIGRQSNGGGGVAPSGGPFAGNLTISGLDTLPSKSVWSGRVLELTAYEFGGQVVLVGTMSFVPEVRTTTVGDATGTAVVTQPVVVHFAVKIAESGTAATIGPFETAPGRTLKIKLKASPIDDTPGGRASAKETEPAREKGASVGVEKGTSK